jgi:cellulose synthase/poly-beta-1,6-N-acetylglucosamine synthase-like glycosyltransferase
MVTLLQWILWSSVAIVVITTLGYPLFLALACPFVRRRSAVAKELDPAPRVTLIVAAYNEEGVIARKLENCLDLDYPRERLEIVVASDGSSDLTNEIVESYADRGITLARFPRTGKTGMQNRMARHARGDILVFSDANAFYRPDALRKLVRHFADSQIGGVCGQLVYRTGSAEAGNSERVYWDYEKFMKHRESALSSVVGANGSIYAVRRTDYVYIDEGLISDFVEPLAIVRRGKRVIYEPEAISEEEASTSYGVEYRRKVRILTRSILGLLSMRQLLNPFRFGIFAIQLFVHKLLRFMTPLFLALAAVSLGGLAVMGDYGLLFILALAGLSVALLIGYSVRTRARPPNPFVRLCQLIFYYVMVNYALTLAWWNVVRGQRMLLWSPERTKPDAH